MTDDDERFLRRAVELAVAGRAAGDAPLGSLLVGPDGAVLAEDHSTVLPDGDITAHPELKLARWAARELDPSGGFPHVHQDGPALLDEARTAVDGYYH